MPFTEAELLKRVYAFDAQRDLFRRLRRIEGMPRLTARACVARTTDWVYFHAGWNPGVCIVEHGTVTVGSHDGSGGASIYSASLPNKNGLIVSYGNSVIGIEAGSKIWFVFPDPLVTDMPDACEPNIGSVAGEGEKIGWLGQFRSLLPAGDVLTGNRTSHIAY
jgi:hypothetical protein